MGANSRIEWCDHTQNFWIGCTKVSTEVTGGGACDFCYAERDFDLRKHIAKWGSGQPRHRTKTSDDPLRWNRRAEEFHAEHGHWPRVFANSLSDFFDLEVPRDWQYEALSIIHRTSRLRWMLTTKRAVNIPKIVPTGWFRDNQHVGVIISICNQPEADRDIPRALQMKADLGIAWLGLSCEPLLGQIDLRLWPSLPSMVQERGVDPVDWVIVGGESGPHARPMHPGWARSLRDQCASAGVPFFFKQWGEYVGVEDWIGYRPLKDIGPSVHVGKKAAGRLLDGRTHDEFPDSLP